MTNSSFLKKLLFAFSVVLFVSCNDDFNEIGSDLVGDDIHYDMEKYIVDVKAYDRATGAVQSNNMTLNQLGVYDNPVFGKTTSHFVTQIEMASENPTLFFPQVDSVYIYVPYYNKPVSGGTDGQTLYTLDSIYGNRDATFRLQVYRNGYYLRDADPGASDNIQRYYSDDRAMVDNLKVGEALYDNPTYSFSKDEIVFKYKRPDNTEKIVERKAPGMLIPLDTIMGKQVLLSNANRGNLLNNNVYKNYFRGLYFKVEQTDGAVMCIPRFPEGTITVKYRDYEPFTDGKPGPDMSRKRISKTLTFNLKGNSINFFENEYTSGFTNAIASNDPNGDKEIYIKGGQGAMAVIDLNDEQLKALTKDVLGRKVLINEANLVFNVNTDAMGVKTADQKYAVEPLRVYLYDLKNQRPLYDYSIDGTSSTSQPKRNKAMHGGERFPFSLDINKRTTRYSIRLTNHINNIIKGDSINRKLALVVTENINTVTNVKLKTPFTEEDRNTPTEVTGIPALSVMHPFGTVLYGGNPEVPLEKRLKLEIYYTKPK